MSGPVGGISVRTNVLGCTATRLRRHFLELSHRLLINREDFCEFFADFVLVDIEEGLCELA